MRAQTRTADASRSVSPSRQVTSTRRTDDQRRTFADSRANDRRDWNDNDRRDRWSNDRRDWGDRDRHRSWERYRYYRAPVDAYRGWDHNRVYSWNNHRYHWYSGSWVIVDPGYAYVETTTLPVVASNVVLEVQAQLDRAGYDPGPVDGVMGGQTRRAIARYQADRGFAATGRIDNALLASLGIN